MVFAAICSYLKICWQHTRKSPNLLSFSAFPNSCLFILTTLSHFLQLESFFIKNGTLRWIEALHQLVTEWWETAQIKELSSIRHTIHVVPNTTLLPSNKAFRKAGILCVTALHLEVATCDRQLQGHHGNLARKDPWWRKKALLPRKKNVSFFYFLLLQLVIGHQKINKGGQQEKGN